MDLGVSILIILILLAFSGFFSGSETALTGASHARMHGLEKDGDKRASLVNRLREKKDRLIGALLLGNNLVNILASALATSVLIKLVGEAGVVYATLIMTLLVLIFAEVLPKTYALHHADSMAMRIAPIMNILVKILSPFTEAIAWIVTKVLKIFGIDIDQVNVGASEEELRGAIEMHHMHQEAQTETAMNGTGGATGTDRRAMLHSILDLADVDVEDIMTHRRNVEALDGDLSAPTLIKQALESPFTRLPVYQGEQENIIGVLHAKDLLREIAGLEGKYDAVNISDIMLNPWFIPESTSLYDQLHAFRERKEHFALVVDEYGSFQGIVTLEDIIEEIVGEIDDEHDLSSLGIKRQNDGSLLVDGTVTIRDLNREFGWSLPDEYYATIAGLIIHESKMVPKPGQSFTFYDLRFDVIKRHRHQITQVRVVEVS